MCVILALSQIDVFDFGTLRSRRCPHSIDNLFIEEEKKISVIVQRP
jgi:hypothetical protein